MSNVPGSNILNQALRAIRRTGFQYYAYVGRTANSAGQQRSTYKSPLSLSGSVQAVSRSLYQQYGLEFQKRYLMIYVSQDVVDVGRDTSGDMIVYNSQNWQVVSITPWFTIDGWVQILAVQVPIAPLVQAGS